MIQYVNLYKNDYQRIREVFEKYGTRKECTENQFLFVKGEPANRIGFIFEGEARTLVSNSDGDELTLFYIGENHMICSEALLGNTQVAVSVQAISPLSLGLIETETFWRAWTELGYPREDLIGHLVSRLTLLSDYICCTHFRDNRKRIAYYLYSCCLINGNTVKLSNQQIAAITGVNRVSVNRILNDFAKEGLLSLEYKKIVILHPDALKAVFGSLSYLDVND